jgi:hypothetical protein
MPLRRKSSSLPPSSVIRAGMLTCLDLDDLSGV